MTPFTLHCLAYHLSLLAVAAIVLAAIYRSCK